MSGAGAAGAAVAAAAAAEAERQRREEEEMTNYTDADLDEDWEFKIIRSNTASFKSREVLQRVCEEEARAGWRLVEKFDNQRLRFKRPVSERANDRTLGIDPYRTQVGMSGEMIAMIAFFGALGLASVVILLIILAKN